MLGSWLLLSTLIILFPMYFGWLNTAFSYMGIWYYVLVFPFVFSAWIGIFLAPIAPGLTSWTWIVLLPLSVLLFYKGSKESDE
jgi:hypothetical protein